MVELADPIEAPVSRPPRNLYCVFQAATILLTVGFSWYARPYEKIFNELGMNKLPTPTEAILAMTGFVRSPFGASALIGLGVVLMIVAIKGGFDRILTKLILLNAIYGLLLIPIGYLSLHLPIAQIRQHLENK